MLEESFELLEKALTLLKGEHFEAWLLLKGPYTGDPGAPAIVDMWRKKRPGLAQWHDFAIEQLATYLKNQDLFVAWPAHMTSRKDTYVKDRNDEFYALYQKLRREGDTKRKAIHTAAEWCEYSEIRGYEIVRLRETGYKRDRRKA